MSKNYKESSESENVFDNVYDQSKDILAGKELNGENIPLLIANVMRVVEKLMFHTSGPEKKEIAIRVIKKLVNQIDDPSTRELVGGICDALLPSAIDIFISIAKGQYGFGKSGGLFSCFGK